MAQPDFFTDGNTPRIWDTQYRIEQKILGAVLDSAPGSGPANYAAGGNFSGVGSPEGVVVASPGATYIDTSTGSFWMKKTGSGTNTGWIQEIA